MRARWLGSGGLLGLLLATAALGAAASWGSGLLTFQNGAFFTDPVAMRGAAPPVHPPNGGGALRAGGGILQDEQGRLDGGGREAGRNIFPPSGRSPNPDASAHPPLKSSEREFFLSTAFLVLLATVTLTLFVSRLNCSGRMRWTSPPVVAVTAGILLGSGIIGLLGFGGSVLRRALTFNEDAFFIFFLPLIIFDSGFSLSGGLARHMFKNCGTVLWFAVLATAISFGVTGALFFLATLLGLVRPQLTWRESLAFGAVVASTDPVPIVPLLHSLAPPPLLRTLILGESLLNDAFSIVIYRSVAESGSLAAGVFAFAGIFFGSIVVGVAVGLIAAVLYKNLSLGKERYNSLVETALLLLFVWISYLSADVARLSGVVAVLFTGITMGHYAHPNLTPEGQRVAEHVFGSLSLLAEITISVLLGVAVCSVPRVPSLTIYPATLVIVSVARGVAVLLTACVANFWRRGDRIAAGDQLVLTAAGLRGAVSFALALRAGHDFRPEVGAAVLSATLFYAIFTVYFGSALMLLLLGRRGGAPGRNAAPPAAADESLGPVKRAMLAADRRWLLPLFTRQQSYQRVGGAPGMGAPGIGAPGSSFALATSAGVRSFSADASAPAAAPAAAAGGGGGGVGGGAVSLPARSRDDAALYWLDECGDSDEFGDEPLPQTVVAAVAAAAAGARATPQTAAGGAPGPNAKASRPGAGVSGFGGPLDGDIAGASGARPATAPPAGACVMANAAAAGDAAAAAVRDAVAAAGGRSRRLKHTSVELILG